MPQKSHYVCSLQANQSFVYRKIVLLTNFQFSINFQKYNHNNKNHVMIKKNTSFTHESHITSNSNSCSESVAAVTSQDPSEPLRTPEVPRDGDVTLQAQGPSIFWLGSSACRLCTGIFIQTGAHSCVQEVNMEKHWSAVCALILALSAVVHFDAVFAAEADRNLTGKFVWLEYV